MASIKNLVRAGWYRATALVAADTTDVATGLSGAGTSSQANATAIVNDVNFFGTVAANAGARLPKWDVGDEFWVYNGGANALLVYPFVGGKINGGATDAALSVAAGKSAFFKRVSDLQFLGVVSA